MLHFQIQTGNKSKVHNYKHISTIQIELWPEIEHWYSVSIWEFAPQCSIFIAPVMQINSFLRQQFLPKMLISRTGYYQRHFQSNVKIALTVSTVKFTKLRRVKQCLWKWSLWTYPQDPWENIVYISLSCCL